MKFIKIFLIPASIFLILFILTNRGYIGYLIHPLPFDGPYSGTVLDASTGKPIAGAKIVAT
ncbi:MAG: carboxypeptidase-like regulatory domain-containing protein, partial [Candidatus Syntrophoarchaeum sp.]|nr:carboxypeptidase-like regulatory domain-containing protein [Candidatus Syntrophoarchaeum sp.]